MDPSVLFSGSQLLAWQPGGPVFLISLSFIFHPHSAVSEPDGSVFLPRFSMCLLSLDVMLREPFAETSCTMTIFSAQEKH